MMTLYGRKLHLADSDLRTECHQDATQASKNPVGTFTRPSVFSPITAVLVASDSVNVYPCRRAHQAICRRVGRSPHPGHRRATSSSSLLTCAPPVMSGLCLMMREPAKTHVHQYTLQNRLIVDVASNGGLTRYQHNVVLQTRLKSSSQS